MTFRKESGRTALVSVIERHKRLKLGHFPTPIEALQRVGALLGSGSVFVKRDDATGVGQGGNKIRALEFILPLAKDAGADTLLTAGVIQSNSARQVAAVAAKLGFRCHIAMISDRVCNTDADYGRTGNSFLDHLYGATRELISMGDDKTVALERIALRLRAEGRRPYIVPYGCANELGAIGYLKAALEICDQLSVQGLSITHLVHATGTGGTQAGLIVGFAALGMRIKVIGIDIDADPVGVKDRVATILRGLADEVDLEAGALEREIVIESGYSAGAYGEADAPTVDAIRMAARLEGLTLDPVYSGKAFAGLIGLSRAGHFKPSDNVLFLHTGGTPAIFAYRSLFGYQT